MCRSFLSLNLPSQILNSVCLLSSAPLATSLFLSHNEALVPPYRIIVDTNFINLSLENRIDMVKGMMDALYAKCKSLAEGKRKCQAGTGAERERKRTRGGWLRTLTFSPPT